jgi:hypothetical protein
LHLATNGTYVAKTTFGVPTQDGDLNRLLPEVVRGKWSWNAEKREFQLEPGDFMFYIRCLPVDPQYTNRLIWGGSWLLREDNECAGEARAGASQQQTNAVPDVISMPVGFAGWPTLTSNEVASLQLRLSQAHIVTLTDLEAELPRASKLVPVSYAFCSPLDRDGNAHLYTETVSVCRLNAQKDIVVVEDDRSRVNVVRKWFIRDIQEREQGSQK